MTFGIYFASKYDTIAFEFYVYVMFIIVIYTVNEIILCCKSQGIIIQVEKNLVKIDTEL